MRRFLGLLLAAAAVQAADLPAWWKAMPNLPRLTSEFIQESESAVFGTLEKEGRLELAQGGRLRVAYTGGLLLVSDGASLVQFDPAARTAQRLALRTAVRDMPLLNVLVDPSALEASYTVKPETNERVLLEPRRKDLPAVRVEGRNGFIRRLAWIDATGAQQVIELKNPRVPRAAFPESTFRFAAPPGTRWID